MSDLTRYPFEIHPLSQEEGGGYLISFPDFSECISDGESIEEAIANGFDALSETIAALTEMGLPVPEPGSGGYSGKFVQRVPKSLHARLARRAKQEGVSMNTMVIHLLSDALARRELAESRNRQKDEQAYLMESPPAWQGEQEE